METKHTKGEWNFKLSKKGNKFIITGFNWVNFCKIYAHAEGKYKQEALANAKLIAAAPDLLEALIELTELEKNKTNNKVGSPISSVIKNKRLEWGKAEQAIKKATE